MASSQQQPAPIPWTELVCTESGESQPCITLGAAMSDTKETKGVVEGPKHVLYRLDLWAGVNLVLSDRDCGRPILFKSGEDALAHAKERGAKDAKTREADEEELSTGLPFEKWKAQDVFSVPVHDSETGEKSYPRPVQTTLRNPKKVAAALNLLLQMETGKRYTLRGVSVVADMGGETPMLGSEPIKYSELLDMAIEGTLTEGIEVLEP